MLSRFFNLDSRLLKYAPWVYASVLILFGLFYGLRPHNIPLFSADAESYINFDPTRTVGYPAFLWLIHKFTGGYAAVAPLQLIIFIGCLGFVALQLARFLGSFLAGMALITGVMMLPEIVMFTAQIFTESLTLSLIFLLIGTLLGHVRKPSFIKFALIGLWLGLLILVRPSSYAFLAILPVLIFFSRDCLLKAALNLMPPVVACVLMGSAANYINHGFFSTQSFLGNNLYGKMLFVVGPGMKGETPLQTQLIEYMLERQRPFRETFKEVRPDLPLYFSLISPLYDKFRFRMFEEARQLHPQINAQKDIDRFCRDLSFTIMRQNFSGYLDDVFLNYGALWLTWELRTKAKREELNYFIEKYRELPHFKAVDLDYSYVKSRNYPDAMVYAAQLFFASTFIISLYFIVVCFFAPWRIRQVNQIGFLLSVIIHSLFVLTALLQAGLSRYAMVMWPVMMIMNILFAYDRTQRFLGDARKS